MLAEIAPNLSENRSNRTTITAHFEEVWNNFIAA